MIHVDSKSLLAQVSVDERLDRLEAALLAQGATFGPVPELPATATIGDAIRARAGRCTPRHGEVWDRVAALEAVFPGGRVVTTKGSPRAATGPDITRTLLEARGQLGEIRKVWLRLLPAPKRRERLVVRAESFGQALVALGVVQHSGARAVEVSLSGTRSAARMVLRFEGDPILVDAELALAKRLVSALVGVSLEEATSASARSALLDAQPESRDALLLEAPWAELSARLGEVFERLGASFDGVLRVVAVMHEGAVIAVPWPEGVPREDTPLPSIPPHVARIRESLVRRCA